MIFGQLGNDTIQGDGSIDYVAHRLISDRRPRRHRRPGVQRRAARPRRLRTGTPGGVVATRSARSTLDPSFEAATDGDDYIEGNGGNDIDLRRPRPGRHRRRQLRLLQPDDRRTSGRTAATCIFGGAGDADRAATTTRPFGDAPPLDARARRRHDRRRQRPTSSASSASTASTSRPADRACPTPRTSRSTTTTTTEHRAGTTEHEARRPRRHAARLHAGRPGLPAGRSSAPAPDRPAATRSPASGAAATPLDRTVHRRRVEQVRRHRRPRRGPRRGRRRLRLRRLRQRRRLRRRPGRRPRSAAGATTGSPAAPATTASSATTAASSRAATAAGCTWSNATARGRRARQRAACSEPLYGIRALLADRPGHARQSNGNVLNEFIYTPGQVQDGDDQRRAAR